MHATTTSAATATGPSTPGEPRLDDTTSPAGRSERRRVRPGLIAAGVASALVGLGIGAVVTGVGPSADGELNLDVALADHRPSLVADLAQAIGVLTGPVVGPLVLLLVCAVLFVSPRRRVTAVILGGLTVVAWLSVVVGKLVFHRLRPPTDTVHALVVETGHDSFPSGHVAFAAALTGALVVIAHLTGKSARTQWTIVLLGALGTALVALSRLWLGAHYLGDVLAAPLLADGTVLVLAGIGVPLLAMLRRLPIMGSTDR